MAYNILKLKDNDTYHLHPLFLSFLFHPCHLLVLVLHQVQVMVFLDVYQSTLDYYI